MSAQHTPGPWEVHHELIDGVETHIRAPIAGHPGDYWWIAGMCGGMLGDWDQANPQLIAAAPTLLAALTTLRDEMKASRADIGVDDWIAIADEALSQASGEAA